MPWFWPINPPPGVDLNRVIRMLILHDLVEIDVGDVPIHAAGGLAHASLATKAAESRAADRIFGLLPTDLGQAFRALWDEFEASESPDAIFAKALDRVQPLMANLMSGGGTWVEYAVTQAQLDDRIGSKIARGTLNLWPYIRQTVAPWFARHRAGGNERN